MVVFFDIDGTIVDNESQIIPESAVRAVHALKENGHMAVVNTGRPLGHIDPRIRSMDFSGWICACGMEIMLDGQWLCREFPEKEACLDAVKSIRECNMQVAYEADEAVYLDGSFSASAQIQAEAELLRKRNLPVRDIQDAPEGLFQKFITRDAPGCRREEFIRRMSRWFICIDRGDTMVEYVKKGFSKAKGIELLMKRLGVSYRDTLAVGDSTNDLPMFSVSYHTACMGNGMEELKKQSEFVTASVLDDGIEKALKHFRLI